MATASPPFASTKETTNYARLCRLLVDVGSEALRFTFDNIHPPATLHTVLSSTSPHYSTLQSLYTGSKKVLSPTQWGNLFPAHSAASSKAFDVTLLTVLLRNICGLSPPALGWDNLPPAKSISIADDIARVKYYRNTLYGHATKASVDDASFTTYWLEIREALVRLGGAKFKADIDNLEIESMDPNNEEHYRELMRQWKVNDDNIKEKLDEIEETIKTSLEQIKSEMENNLRCTLKKLEGEVKEVKEQLGTLTASKIESKEEGIFDPDDIIDVIKQLYKTREGWLAPFPWCEDFQFRLGEIFIRLKVVRRKKTRGTVTEKGIKVSSLFDPHEECSKPRTVLIEGEPGVGKTTYCKYFVYKWASRKQKPEEFLSRYKAVLLLKCRDIKSDLWNAIDEQLLTRDIQEGVRKEFFQFIRDNQSHILLLLDGLDELPSSKLPIFSEILEGRVLPKCHIVATARQEVGIKVRKSCDTLLEIEGFTKKHTRKFIVKYFKTRADLAEKLWKRMLHDDHLKEMAANPLNTALLCLLCEEFEGILSEKRADLYLEIIQCVLRRYRKRKGLSETEDDLKDVYKSQLKRLGSIALNGLRDDNLNVEESKLRDDGSDLPELGFLSVQPSGSKLRPGLHYAFLHKSFQQCFAAFYICCQIQDQEITCDELVSDSKYLNELKEVLFFACSILAVQCPEQAMALVTSLIGQVDKYGDNGVYVVLEAIKESTREQSDAHLELARCFGRGFQLQSIDIKSGRALGKAITTSLAEAVKVNMTLTTLKLNFNDMGDNGAISLASGIKVNRTLTVLELMNNSIGDAGVTSIAEAIKINKSLTDLKVGFNDIGDIGAASIAEAIRVNSSLTLLELYCNRIGDAGVICIADAIKVNKALTDLQLSNNDIGDAGAASIAEAIKVNKTLTSLELNCNDIGNAGATSIAEAVKFNQALTVLELSSNDIGDAGATSIAETVKFNKTLSVLVLSNCGICDTGAILIAEAMKVNKTLTVLEMSNNDIGDVGVAAIAEAIEINQALKELGLWKNSFGYTGVTSIAEAIKVNNTLVALELSSSGIGDADATSIAEAIKVNKTLIDLELSNNAIGDAGATSIAEAIKVNEALTELKMSFNNIADTGATSLAESIKVNKTLTVLKLSNNRIGDAGVESFAEAIKVNKTLEYLNLMENHFGDAGTTFIVEAMKVNKVLATISF